jgi:hypothetical protein
VEKKLLKAEINQMSRYEERNNAREKIEKVPTLLILTSINLRGRAHVNDLRGPAHPAASDHSVNSVNSIKHSYPLALLRLLILPFPSIH